MCAYLPIWNGEDYRIKYAMEIVVENYVVSLVKCPSCVAVVGTLLLSFPPIIAEKGKTWKCKAFCSTELRF